MSIPSIKEEVTDPCQDFLVQGYTKLFRTHNPEIAPASLNEQVQKLISAHQKIAALSSTPGQLNNSIENLRQTFNQIATPDEQLLLTSTLENFRAKEKKILKERGLTVAEYADAELTEEISQAAQVSLQQAKDIQKKTCTYCQKPNQPVSDSGTLKYLLKRCSACKKAIYCSLQCQRADWPKHKAVCQLKTT